MQQAQNPLMRKRIIHEIEDLKKNPIQNVSVCSEFDEHNYEFFLLVDGPKNSPYENGKFKVRIYFRNYPFEPPYFQLVTKIFHPAFDFTNELCCCQHDIYKEKWRPSSKLKEFIQFMIQWFYSPAEDHTHNLEAWDLYKNNYQQFYKAAQEYTNKYAKEEQKIQLISKEQQIKQGQIIYKEIKDQLNLQEDKLDNYLNKQQQEMINNYFKNNQQIKIQKELNEEEESTIANINSVKISETIQKIKQNLKEFILDLKIVDENHQTIKNLKIDFFCQNQRNFISKGSFGKVYQAYEPKLNQMVCFKINIDGISYQEIEGVFKEYALIKYCNSKNIQGVLNVYDAVFVKRNDQSNKYNFIFTMHKCDLSLKKIIELRQQQQNFYQESQLIQILNWLTLTFKQLQQLEIAHLDIKPENILYDQSKYYISDFGISEIIKQNNFTTDGIIGSPAFQSPELYSLHNQNKSKQSNLLQKNINPFISDVYSLGITMLCLFKLKTHFNRSQLQIEYQQLLNKKDKNQIEQLIVFMLNENPTFRYDFVQLHFIINLKNAFFDFQQDSYLIKQNYLENPQKRFQDSLQNIKNCNNLFSVDLFIEYFEQQKILINRNQFQQTFNKTQRFLGSQYQKITKKETNQKFLLQQINFYSKGPEFFKFIKNIYLTHNLQQILPYICNIHYISIDYDEKQKNYTFLIIYEYGVPMDQIIKRDREKKSKQIQDYVISVQQILKNIAYAGQFLQKNSLTYKNIEPKNILLTKQGYSLIDFSYLDQNIICYSSTFDEYQKKLFGQKVFDNKITFNYVKKDVWELGLSLVYFINAHQQNKIDILLINFENSQNYLAREDLWSNKISQFLENIKANFKKFHNILSNMLLVDENKRFDFIQIYEQLNEM